MFCPKCRAEYRRGFARCSDCDVKLVDELTPQIQREDIDGETQADCVMPLWRGLEGDVFADIIEALEQAGIRYRFRILEVKITFSATYAPFEICVGMAQVEDARRILSSVVRRITGRPGANEPEGA